MGIIIDASLLKITNGRKGPSVTDFPEFHRLFAALPPGRVLLASDFDGTLSEIVSEPGSAVLVPEAEDALRVLAGRLLAVAILSGRSTADLRRRLPVPGLVLLGDYGLETASPAQLVALRECAASAREFAARRPGISVELKQTSLSIHHRQAPGAAAELQAALKPVCERLGLQLRGGRMVIEVMPRGADKEAALDRLIERRRPGGVVWLGDDSGDRGCFELVAGLTLPHLAVGVWSLEAPEGLFEACDLVLPGPAAAAGLLTRLAGWASPAQPDREGRESGG